MNNRLALSSLILFLIIALMFTLGMVSFPSMQQSVIKGGSNNATVPELQASRIITPTAIKELPLGTTSTLYAEKGPLQLSKTTASDTTTPTQPSTESSSDQSQASLSDTKMEKQEIVLLYEVTAYFLNVRSKPDPQSSILQVTKQGDRLEAIGETENGWLELKAGGYVKASYTTALSPDSVNSTKEKGKVSIAGAEAADTSSPAEAVEVKEQAAGAPDKKQLAKPSSPDKPTKQVDSDSGLTEEHIELIFEGTALAGHGLEQAILEIEQEHGINAFFTIAVMKLESGNGKSRIAKNKNNLFGLNAIDGDQYNKAFSFKTKGDSVKRFGELLAKHYVGKGLETIDQVARKYCPSNSKWPSLVMSIMKSDYRKL